MAFSPVSQHDRQKIEIILFAIYLFLITCVWFGVQVLSLCTRLSPVCSLLHFMVPAYSESVYATDVLRLCESAFSAPPPPSAALSQGDDVTQTLSRPPHSESRRITEERDETDWRDGIFMNRSDWKVAKMSCHRPLTPVSTGCNGAGVAEPPRPCYDS